MTDLNLANEYLTYVADQFRIQFPSARTIVATLDPNNDEITHVDVSCDIEGLTDIENLTTRYTFECGSDDDEYIFQSDDMDARIIRFPLMGE